MEAGARVGAAAGAPQAETINMAMVSRLSITNNLRAFMVFSLTMIDDA
jgi:hypothetical protein